LADQGGVAALYPGQRVNQAIVEVDGAYHARRSRAAERRELKLTGLGHRVVRVSAQLVLMDLAAAVALVRAAL
jgi:very-short-patch-repair endonuclease